MNLISKLLSIIYPPRCPYCSNIIDDKSQACEKCCKKVYINSELRYLDIEPGTRTVCCSPFIYKGIVRKAIINFKFYSKTSFVNAFSNSIVAQINKTYTDVQFDYVSCIPMGKKAKRKRGFNQSELLAKQVAKKLNTPYVELIIKSKETKEQHSLNLAQRQLNIKGAYTLKNNIAENKNILLIDDIITTGSTLQEACKTLLYGKVKLIMCATLANAKIEGSFQK